MVTTEEVKFNAQSRDVHGTGAARRMRREGSIPAVIYGEGKPAREIQLPEHDFEMLLKRNPSDSFVLDISIGDDASEKVMLKTLQIHPISNKILHVDFTTVNLTKKVKVAFNLDYIGEPVGVEQGGGTLDIHVRQVEVECLAMDMLSAVEVDVSALEIGDHLSVGDLSLDPSKFTVQTASDIALVTVAAPRVATAEETEEEAEAAAAAEPEVINEKKEEDAE